MCLSVVGRRRFLSKSRNASSDSSWMVSMRSLANRPKGQPGFHIKSDAPPYSLGVPCHQAAGFRFLPDALRDFDFALFLLDDDDLSAAARLPRPLTLWRRASIRSTTLDGRSAGSSYSI